ncbi:MAG: bifunctional oligoribonuclease/PAP phosphatase NrnA [Bacilli bacterium]|nr:bifunctional oligoribonuclease/PAP phosphatase NrnA [Bacilli bacterium]
MISSVYKRIYKEIKKYDTIVIARHVGPDPDALGSQFGLKEIILNTFPNKKVYCVGAAVSKFKFIGIMDKFDESWYDNALLIITDTPDRKRVDGVDPDRFKYKIKIDHHPTVDDYCDIEWVDDTASSASQLIMELSFNTPLKINTKAAEDLYVGLVSDTNRFMYSYTTAKTFDLVSKLIKKTNLNFTGLYENLYLRPFKEIQFQGYLATHMNITENGLGYIMLTDEVLKEHEVDSSTASNMVSNFNYIDEIYAWVIFSDDKANDTIRGSIRSRGPVINTVAASFGGGGHAMASGVRVKTMDEVENIIKALDKTCKEYKKELKHRK